jgi:hypothetical protein
MCAAHPFARRAAVHVLGRCGEHRECGAKEIEDDLEDDAGKVLTARASAEL